jgi:PAS domain S-box-containing protein
VPHIWIRENLFDQVPVAICVIDHQFQIVEANKRFTEWYGEWEGHRCYEVYKDRSEMCLRCGAAKTFVDGKVREREEEGVDRRGRPTNYIVRIVPVVRDDGDIPYVFEMSSDITELKNLQRQKLEAERLAAVGQTVAGLAHGIKNLIMGLEGGMYVVNSGLRSNNEERLLQGWRMLEEDIGRISSFVKEFLGSPTRR